MRLPAAASLTAAAAKTLVPLRPTHSRVIMPAVITVRDSTTRHSAMRGSTAAWRAVAQGGPHQEAMAIPLSGLDCSLQMTRTAMKRAAVTAALTGRPSMSRPEMKSPATVRAALIKTTASQKNGSESGPHRGPREQYRHDGRKQD